MSTHDPQHTHTHTPMPESLSLSRSLCNVSDNGTHTHGARRECVACICEVHVRTLFLRPPPPSPLLYMPVCQPRGACEYPLLVLVLPYTAKEHGEGKCVFTSLLREMDLWGTLEACEDPTSSPSHRLTPCRCCSSTEGLDGCITIRTRQRATASGDNGGPLWESHPFSTFLPPVSLSIPKCATTFSESRRPPQQ